jgi:hypothetical protein
LGTKLLGIHIDFIEARSNTQAISLETSSRRMNESLHHIVRMGPKNIREPSAISPRILRGSALSTHSSSSVVICISVVKCSSLSISDPPLLLLVPPRLENLGPRVVDVRLAFMLGAHQAGECVSDGLVVLGLPVVDARPGKFIAESSRELVGVEGVLNRFPLMGVRCECVILLKILGIALSPSLTIWC